jgi:putative ABC transport system substrate-binding protein
MRRREFITLLAGATAAWPLPAPAQQPERMRRIGVLWPYTEADPDSRSRIASLRKALQDLGWIEGRNVQFDYRWGASAEDRERIIRRYATELTALAPDVIVAGSGGIAIELRQTTRTVPIVFPTANDPVGTGLVETLARPGGNATGFTGFESGQTEKFLDLLKEIAPQVTRVAVIRNPTRGGGKANFAAIQAAAAPLRMEVSPIDLRDVDGMERGVADFASAPNGGLIVSPAALATTRRGVIIALAARYRLPWCIPCAYSSPTVAWRPTDLSRPTSTRGRPAISIASSKARSRATCRWGFRPASNCPSTARPQERWASTCRRSCSHAPTR